jgi:hypothetical protein
MPELPESPESPEFKNGNWQLAVGSWQLAFVVISVNQQ